MDRRPRVDGLCCIDAGTVGFLPCVVPIVRTLPNGERASTSDDHLVNHSLSCVVSAALGSVLCVSRDSACSCCRLRVRSCRCIQTHGIQQVLGNAMIASGFRQTIWKSVDLRNSPYLMLSFQYLKSRARSCDCGLQCAKTALGGLMGASFRALTETPFMMSWRLRHGTMPTA